MKIKKNVQPASYWQQHLDGWAKSGLSQSVYCNQQRIAPSTFYKWRKKLLGHIPDTVVSLPKKMNEESQDFIELSVEPEQAQSQSEKHWDIELQLGSAIVLRMSER